MVLVRKYTQNKDQTRDAEVAQKGKQKLPKGKLIPLMLVGLILVRFTVVPLVWLGGGAGVVQTQLAVFEQ